MAALAQTILYTNKNKMCLYKMTQANAAILKSSVFEWSVHIYGSEHSKTEPFENRILKCSVFEWIRNSNVRYSSPHCILKHAKSVITANFLHCSLAQLIGSTLAFVGSTLAFGSRRAGQNTQHTTTSVIHMLA